jgi:hypothetical protein
MRKCIAESEKSANIKALLPKSKANVKYEMLQLDKRTGQVTEYGFGRNGCQDLESFDR